MQKPAFVCRLEHFAYYIYAIAIVEYYTVLFYVLFPCAKIPNGYGNEENKREKNSVSGRGGGGEMTWTHKDGMPKQRLHWQQPAEANPPSRSPYFQRNWCCYCIISNVRLVLHKPCRKRTCDFLITRRTNASLNGFLSASVSFSSKC